jgi:hypothetical protein
MVVSLGDRVISHAPAQIEFEDGSRGSWATLFRKTPGTHRDPVINRGPRQAMCEAVGGPTRAFGD